MFLWNKNQRSHEEAFDIFGDLMEDFYSSSTPVRKRLEMIKKNWKYLTAFYFVEGAPATNNLLENYYSTSLKTHRKTQLRKDKGINNQMKLSAMKRAGMLKKPARSILEAHSPFKS